MQTCVLHILSTRAQQGASIHKLPFPDAPFRTLQVLKVFLAAIVGYIPEHLGTKTFSELNCIAKTLRCVYERPEASQEKRAEE